MLSLIEPPIRSSAQAAAPTANVLEDLPLAGTPVGWLDGALEQFGLGIGVREIVELVLLALLLYRVGRWLVARLAPWLGTSLVAPATGLVAGLRLVLLLLDMAVARTSRALRFHPPGVIYAYGSMVLSLADHLQTAARTGLPLMAHLKAWSGRITITALVVLALTWNSTYCEDQGAHATCESPAAQVYDSIGSAWKAVEEHGN